MAVRRICIFAVCQLDCMPAWDMSSEAELNDPSAGGFKFSLMRRFSDND